MGVNAEQEGSRRDAQFKQRPGQTLHSSKTNDGKHNKAAREGRDGGALHDDAVAALRRRSVRVFAFADGTPDRGHKVVLHARVGPGWPVNAARHTLVVLQYLIRLRAAR